MHIVLATNHIGTKDSPSFWHLIYTKVQIYNNPQLSNDGTLARQEVQNSPPIQIYELEA